MSSASRLVATSIVRTWRTRRLRALATAGSAVIGVMLITMVVAVVLSILTAVRAGTGLDAVDADIFVGARSPAGMAPDVAGAARAAAEEGDDAVSASATIANTRIAGERDAVLTIIGLDGDPGTFLPTLAVEHRAIPFGLVVSEAWADRNDLAVGDTVRLNGPGGGRVWTIAATTDASVPNNGAIALAARADVQDGFERGGTDAVLVALADGDAGPVVDRLRAAVGGAAIVGSADDVVAPEQTSFAQIRQLLVMVGGVGLLTAGTVLFVCWRLLVEDERETIGRLRLAGASPRTLVAGSAVLFIGVTAAAIAVGIPLGLVAAGVMTAFARQVVNLTGLAAAPQPAGVFLPAAAGAMAGLTISAAAWLAGLRACLAVPAIEAIRGTPIRSPRSAPAVRLLAIAVALAGAAAVLSRILPPRLAGGALVVGLAAAVVGAFALLPLAGRLLRRRGGFVRLSAGREVSGGPGVRPGMISVLAVALILSISLAGVSTTLGDGLRSSVEAWTGGDLYVLPAEPGANLRDEKFDPGVAPRLEALPSVDSVVPFTLAQLKYEGRNVQLYAWGTDDVADAVDLHVDEGVAGDRFWDSLSAGEVAVSTNFAWLHHLDVGDHLELPTAEGTFSARIAATVEDYTGDTGIIFTSYDTYTAITGDPRPYDLIVDVAPGVPIDQARAEISDELADYAGLTMWTGTQMENHLMGLFGQVLSIIQVMGLAGLVLAILLCLTTVIGSLSGRRLAVGLARLSGATRPVVLRQLLLEASSVGILAWAIALPVGALSVRTMVHAIGATSGSFPPIHVNWLLGSAMLVGALAAAAVAVWLPSRRLVAVDVAEVITHE